MGLTALAVSVLVACQPGPPPRAVDVGPLFYARDRGDPSRLIAFDWSGHRRASITAVSPNEGSGAVYLDPLGKPMGSRWRPVEVPALSGDGTRRLVVQKPAQYPNPIRTSVIDVKRGTLVWSREEMATAVSYLPRPAAGDLALAWRQPGGAACGMPPCWLDVVILIVHSNGATTALVGRYLTYW